MANKAKKELILLIVILLMIAALLTKEFLFQPKPQPAVFFNPQKSIDNVGEDKFSLTDKRIDCDSFKKEIMSLLDKENFCDQDSDCVMREGMGCPFGCYTLANKASDLSAIRSKANLYNKNCMTCEYECMAAKEDEIKCKGRKCVNKGT